MAKTRNAAKPLSSISVIPLWLSPVNRPATLTTRESEKDESVPWGSLSSLFIPAGRLGSEALNAPEGVSG